MRPAAVGAVGAAQSIPARPGAGRMAHDRPTSGRRRHGSGARTIRGMPDLGPILPVLIPLIVIQLALLILAIYDLFQEDRRVRWFAKPVWACIIVFVNIVGPLAYFFIGREDL